MLYTYTLLLHSYLRWLLLGLALALVLRALAGWRAAWPWTKAAERLHVAFVGTVDLQFTLGAILYLFLSPIARVIWLAPGAAMKESTLRFFGLEHALVMLIAVSLVHIGRTRAKRAADPPRKQRTVFVTTLIALLLLVAGVPWPFLRYGRPLLRTSAAFEQLIDQPPHRGDLERLVDARVVDPR